MSLLSPDFLSDSLSVFVAPDELVAVRWRGLPSRIVDKGSVSVATGDKSDPPWAGAAAAFADLLRSHPSCRRVRLSLSSHFTAYQLMPWRADLEGRDEELALARLAFAETYGSATPWELRLADAPPGVARLAAAVDADLIAALERAALANKARIVSLQPALVAVVNHWRARFTGDTSAWIVVHEPGRLCIALITRGPWRWVRSLRAGADWSVELPDILDHETLLAGIDNPPAQALIFSATSQPAVRADSRWSLRALMLDALPDFSPVHDSRYAPALIG